MVKTIALFDDAMDIAKHHAIELPIQSIPLANASGRTLAQDAMARIDVPPFHRAMMDGFAVRSEDCAQAGARLQVIGMVAAGDPSHVPLQQGQAIRIMTGAPVPPGADAVARFEWCDDARDAVQVLKSIATGESVQRQGEDGLAGTRLITAGTPLSGAECSVLQAFGVAQVDVYAKPRVALIITGSELVETPNTPLGHGQIYGSNHILLASALEDSGAEVVSTAFVSDNPAHLSEALLQAAQRADYVLTTGGVSQGDHDYLPRILYELQAAVAVEKVLMRPGSPLVIAHLKQATVFAMSGNPAACFAQFACFVRPTIRRSLGLPDGAFPASGRLVHDVAFKSIKHVRILRAKANIVDGVVRVDVRLAQSPGVVSSFIEANCLIRLDEDELPAGAVVPLQWLRMP
jgi:molybdopterin molybdotransferase